MIIERDENGRLSLLLQVGGFRFELLRIGNASRTQELRFPNEHASTINLTRHTAASGRLEIGNGGKSNVAFFCAAHDRSGKWVFTVLLNRCSSGKQSLLGNGISRYNSR